MGFPFLTVIIPTHNRSNWLDTVIGSLKNQAYPADYYEILIVDNASEDDTHTKAMALCQENSPVVRYLYESQLGISPARNCGAAAARGEVIVYIDDDAIAEPGWLSAIAKIFSADPEVVCVGGRIELWWEKERPDWFGVELEGYLGGNAALGEEERPFPPGKYPFGGNLAIRKDTFFSVPGGFNARFGHAGKRLGAHDETRMIDHLREKGKIIYSPDACIRHYTPASRATRRYLAKRAFFIGKADAELDQQRRPHSRFGLIRSILANSVFLIGDLGRYVRELFQNHQAQASRELILAFSRSGRLLRSTRMAFTF